MLGAMSAGGCYLALELAYPPPLLASTCADCSPAAVITTAELAKRLPEGVPTLLVESGGGLARSIEAHFGAGGPPTHAELLALRAAAPRASLEDLAFMVYTSGTTGRPKGIENPHRAPAMSYAWRFGHSDLGCGRASGGARAPGPHAARRAARVTALAATSSSCGSASARCCAGPRRWWCLQR